MAEEEAPRVFEAPGGLCVSYRGRLLYSGRDPARLPRRVGSACDPGPARLHLVPSPLLWYGMSELLAAMGPGSAALCVEADPALERIARERMPPELAADGRVRFVAAADPGRAVEAARELGSFRACSVAALSGGEALNAPLYRAMAAAISAELEAEWRNRAALMILGERWARNVLDNVAAMPEISPEPPPRLGGATVVCGAGPSLEAALPFISRLRGRLSVVACDTALGTLLAAGVEPDLVVCLEAQAHNLPDFTCLGSRPIRLAADLSSHPAVLHAVRGPKHLTSVRITRSPFLSRAEAALREAGIPFSPAPPLGSVGVHACYLAGEISEGPMLAAGLDFSFEAGKTHARGCPALLAEERALGRLRRWGGQYESSFRSRTLKLPSGALSDPILLSYAKVLADLSSGGEGGARGRAAFYDIRGRGPSIGARPLALAEAEALVAGSAPALSSGAAAAGERSAGAEDPRPAVARFIAGELERVRDLRASMRGARASSREDFLALALELDYLWWGFPDQDRVADLPQDFLNRLAPQAERWLGRLESLSEAVRAGS